MPNSFENYLREAFSRALKDERDQTDDGNLERIRELCRRGVLTNWKALTAERYLGHYLWCIGSTRKDYAVHRKYEAEQIELFRNCVPEEIASQTRLIVRDWVAKKCYLNNSMVAGMIDVSREIVQEGWPRFKKAHLLLPDNPETEAPLDWKPAIRMLRSLPMIGKANSWYMIRNLYGAPFFKPDVHIDAIASHFFGRHNEPVNSMTAAVRKEWPTICTDPHFLPVHIGEVDLILWWHRRATGLPVA